MFEGLCRLEQISGSNCGVKSCGKATDRIRTGDLRFTKPPAESASFETCDSYNAANGSVGVTAGNSIVDGTSLPINTIIDAELRRVVMTWPSLPEPIRRAVLALVDTVPSVTGTGTPANGRDNEGFGDDAESER